MVSFLKTKYGIANLFYQNKVQVDRNIQNPKKTGNFEKLHEESWNRTQDARFDTAVGLIHTFFCYGQNGGQTVANVRDG